MHLIDGTIEPVEGLYGGQISSVHCVNTTKGHNVKTLTTLTWHQFTIKMHRNVSMSVAKWYATTTKDPSRSKKGLNDPLL